MTKTPYLGARARHFAATLSWPGIAGIVLLLLALVVGVINALHVRPANEAAQASVTALSEQLAQVRSRPAPAPVLDPEQTLLSSLPGADGITEFVELVHDEAVRQDVIVESADYRTETPLAGKALRYRISIPVRGNYLQIRAWIDQVMAKKPSSSLDELALKREADGAGVLTGRVQLSYFTRAAR